MTAVFSLLIVVTFAVFVTRIASSALMLTGLSFDVARFQARSAFTGCGFTTQEAEDMVRHPVRRRVVMLLMLLGNAGLVTAISSLLLSFVNLTGTETAWLRATVLAGGLAALWLLTRSRWLDHYTCRLFERVLRRWPSMDVQDYASLLNLTGEFTVAEIDVDEGDWLAEKALRELDLKEEGIIVLAIRREDGDYVGVPSADERFHSGDRVVLYGQDEAVRSLDKRDKNVAGEASREQAIRRESSRKRKQEARERMREEEYAQSRAEEHS